MKTKRTHITTAAIAAALLTMTITAAATAQVTTFAELQNAIATATDNESTEILIGADFAITTGINIQGYKNITIRSADAASPRTLTRQNHRICFFMVLNGALTLKNIVLDGNKDYCLSTQQGNCDPLVVVRKDGFFTMDDGAVLQNNFAPQGGAVLLDSQ